MIKTIRRQCEHVRSIVLTWHIKRPTLRLHDIELHDYSFLEVFRVTASAGAHGLQLE
jgi:hypothetical protein